MDEWRFLQAVELGRRIGRGDIDPVALAQHFLEAIDASALTSSIYARLTRDRALAEARATSERVKAGARRGPLDGVPVSWKDLYDSAGVATEAGSALLRDRIPARDAAVLRNATAAGLVCLGKTHMTELAFSGLGLNPMTASPPCVNDAEAVAGGSSSGAATSVAFGLAACGIGSDTGGSIRAPSVWNDLVGFKPTQGGLSMEGVLPLCPRFDALGPLARGVEDAALVWAAMGARPAPDLRGATVRGARLMVLETSVMDDLAPEAAAGFERGLDRFAAAGAHIERREIPEVARADAQSKVVFAGEAYGVWRDVIEAAPERMFDQVRERFRGGRDVSSADYVAAWRILDECRAAYARATAGFDAVLLPTCPILPPKKARLETDGAYFQRANLMTLRNTRVANLLGLPAITMPTGVPSTGIMLQSRAGSDAHLLRLAAAAESALA